MAKFVTIGYGDQAGYDRTDPATGRDDDMKGPSCVVMPAASGLRTWMGCPATPMSVPRS